jgi:hypothetical protein
MPTNYKGGLEQAVDFFEVGILAAYWRGEAADIRRC